MDYEKKYKEALEMAQKLYQDCPNGKNDRIYHTTDLEKIFPELQESEEEKTRKRIIALVNAHGQGMYKGDMLAWLEKQGEQNPFDYENANIQQKDFAPKVEPKFKAGDWIISKYMHLVMQILNNDNGSYKTVETDGTERNDSYDFIERNFKLWTIQDAKDGDVLWHSDTASHGTFIFKQIRYDGKVLCYCDYDSEDHFCTGEHHTCCWSSDKCIKPATKEQRDLLFTKMRKAGYEWDAENLQLTKILHVKELSDGINIDKQKLAEWSEEDEKTWKELIEEVKDQLDSVPAPDCRDKEDEKVLKQLTRWLVWLKSLKDRYTWKPSDEQIGVIEVLIENRSFQRRHLVSLYEQLKKLKGE